MATLRSVGWMIALGVLAGTILWGCAGLIPPNLMYQVHMEALLPEGRGDYYVDYEDSTQVFSREGVLIKVRHLDDDYLNREIRPLHDGRHINPYTLADRDPRIGYIPPLFTVFQITVINETYAKVEFDPANAVLITDRGDEFRFYDSGREGASPTGANTFSVYYEVERGISGYEKELNLERMGVVYKTIYHRNRPVFRGDQRTGKLIFDPLPHDTREVILRINGFVLSFDASGNPAETVDVEFRFAVNQDIVELVEADKSRL